MTEVATIPPFNALSLEPPKDRPWGVNLGAGEDSTAMLGMCAARGWRPHWVLFCDTGSERAATYDVVRRLRQLCDYVGFPFSVTWWKRTDGPVWTVPRPRPGSPMCEQREVLATEWVDGVRHILTAEETLAEYSLRTRYMPSKAYGYNGCSYKYKQQPAERWRKENGFERTVYAVGFHAGEPKRVNKRKCQRSLSEYEADQMEPWYPLYANGIGRDGVREIVAGMQLAPGVPLGAVGKSACTFCPSSRREEWIQLRDTDPDLFAEALQIEQAAREVGNAEKNGLRRRLGYLADLGTKQELWDGDGGDSFAEAPEEDRTCMCSDGDPGPTP